MKFTSKCLFLKCIILISLAVTTLADSENKEESTCIVRVKDRLLTVKLKDMPVKKVLMEIADQAQIKIKFYGPVGELISADFSDIPLDKGLRRLSFHSNYAFIYGPRETENAEPEIQEIIITPKTGKKKDKRVEPTIIASKLSYPEEKKEFTLESLAKVLADEDPIVREEMIYSLSDFEDKRILKHLGAVLLNDEDPTIRAAAAEELGDFEGKEAVDILIKGLEDEDARVRQSIIEALEKISREEVIPKLMEALADEDENVRNAAGEALGDIKDRPSSH